MAIFTSNFTPKKRQYLSSTKTWTKKLFQRIEPVFTLHNGINHLILYCGQNCIMVNVQKKIIFYYHIF